MPPHPCLGCPDRTSPIVHSLVKDDHLVITCHGTNHYIPDDGLFDCDYRVTTGNATSFLEHVPRMQTIPMDELWVEKDLQKIEQEKRGGSRWKKIQHQ